MQYAKINMNDSGTLNLPVNLFSGSSVPNPILVVPVIVFSTLAHNTLLPFLREDFSTTYYTLKHHTNPFVALHSNITTFLQSGASFTSHILTWYTYPMTVKDLITKLQEFDQDLEIYVSDDGLHRPPLPTLETNQTICTGYYDTKHVDKIVEL
jgi:hypothetical protein